MTIHQDIFLSALQVGQYILCLELVRAFQSIPEEFCTVNDIYCTVIFFNCSCKSSGNLIVIMTHRKMQNAAIQTLI